MPPVLVTNEDGSLRGLNAAEVAGLQLKRRGVRSEHDHWTAQFGPDGCSCTRRYSCAWGQRFQALLHFVGASRLYTTTSGTKLSRMVPQKDPDYPEWVCTKCDIMPWRFKQNLASTDDPEDPFAVEATNPGYMRGTHTPVFDRAELKCTFEMTPFDVKSDLEITDELDRYVTNPGFGGTEISSEANYVGLPGSALQYAVDGGGSAPKPGQVPIPFPVGFVEPLRKLSIVWHRIPMSAWGPGTSLFNRVIGSEEHRGVLGAVNRTTFLGYWSLTLQLIGVEERLLPDPTGMGFSWNLRYTFTHKPVTFGHLGLYYHANKVGEGTAGYYMALRPAAAAAGTLAPEAITDDKAMFVVREFEDLLKVGSV